MAQILAAKSYSDFSKANWQSVASSVVPENSVKLAMNMNSDVVLGQLISRKGTTLIGAQIVNNSPVVGLHNYRGTLSGTEDKLFAVVSDGTNNDIYDVVAESKSLQDDTKDLRTNFLTYLDSCLRLNGFDAPKAWDGTQWKTTGGAFDLDNLPSGSKFCIEFKDQVYVAGRSDSPDRIDYSNYADPATKTISWSFNDNEPAYDNAHAYVAGDKVSYSESSYIATQGTTGNYPYNPNYWQLIGRVGRGFLIPEREDGGGGITGFGKVPGYLMIFKRRTLKRFDGVSANPEDMVNEGSPSQQCIVMAKGLVAWMNENDAWVSNGGMPIAIGSFMVREVIKSISAADLLNVAGGTDEEHFFWSIPSCTISGETYTNVVLKYNIQQQTWDIRQYPTFPMCFTKTVAANDEVYVTFGDDNGNVQILDFGDTDNGTDISWSMETHDWSFGLKLFQKGISRMGVITENVSTGSFEWRNNHKPESWKAVGDGNINMEVTDFVNMDLRGNYYNFRAFGTTNSGQVKFIGVEFPEGIKVFDSSST